MRQSRLWLHNWRESRAARKALNKTLNLHTEWILASVNFLHDFDPEAAHRLMDNVTDRTSRVDATEMDVGYLADSVKIVLGEYNRVEWG